MKRRNLPGQFRVLNGFSIGSGISRIPACVFVQDESAYIDGSPEIGRIPIVFSF